MATPVKITAQDFKGHIWDVATSPTYYRGRTEDAVPADDDLHLVHVGYLDDPPGRVVVECRNPLLLWSIVRIKPDSNAVSLTDHYYPEPGPGDFACAACRLLYGGETEGEVEGIVWPPGERPGLPRMARTYQEAEALLQGWHINSAEARNLRASFNGAMLWRMEVEPVVVAAALKMYAKGQRKRGWPGMDDPVMREAAKQRTLHRERNLPPEISQTIAYQAYVYSLPEREQAAAKAAGNGIHWLPPRRIKR